MSIEEIKQKQLGFIREADIDAVIKESRLHPCLVRCGCGRFSCPAQDVKHFIGIIGKEGSDYVRDVSLL